jgi:hypothetical protein
LLLAKIQHGGLVKAMGRIRTIKPEFTRTDEASPHLSNSRQNGKRVAVMEAEIEVPDLWPNFDPGEYRGYCRRAHVYRDPQFQRWTCLLVFDLLDAGLNSLGTVPMFLNMGDGEKPRATRRGRFLEEWCRANGGPPRRRDRLSLRVFIRRIARIKVGASSGVLRSSKVEKILGWDTGSSISTGSPLQGGNEKSC